METKTFDKVIKPSETTEMQNELRFKRVSIEWGDLFKIFGRLEEGRSCLLKPSADRKYPAVRHAYK